MLRTDTCELLALCGGDCIRTYVPHILVRVLVESIVFRSTALSRVWYLSKLRCSAFYDVLKDLICVTQTGFIP
jgi:hypothetical protein